MFDRSSVLSSSPCYDRFLYAPILEQRNGTQLTVLSALARSNADPWEEAGRLAAMPRADAETALAAVLCQISDENWIRAESEAVAARLIEILVPKDERGSTASTVSTTNELNRSIFWWIWLGFAIAASLGAPRNQTKTVNLDAVTTSSVVSTASDNVSKKE
jgi:hypothetical protein